MKQMDSPYLPKLDRDALLSRTFDALKWILAVMVVCDHYIRYQWFPGAPDKTAPLSGMLSNFVYSFIINYEVPVFFVMSGFLFCTTSRIVSQDYRHKLSSRLVSLGIPYVVFTIFGMIVALFRCHMADDYSAWHQMSLFDKITGFYNLFPINTPLWYLRDLLLLCLIAPLIHWLLKWSHGWIMLPLALLFVFGFSAYGKSHYIIGPFFFTAGYMLRLREVRFLDLSRRAFPFLLTIYVVLGLCIASHGIPTPGWVKNLNMCIFVPMIVAGTSYLVERGRLSTSAFLVSASFFLYLTHHPLRYIMVGMFKRYWPDMSDLEYIISITTAVVMLITATVAVFWMLQRNFPRFTSFIMGARTGSKSKSRSTSPVARTPGTGC